MLKTMSLPTEVTAIAPDGSDVRVLLGFPTGGLAHFELAAGETSVAVSHRTVAEVWFFLAGEGEMWRQLGSDEDTIEVQAGVCLTIPVGASFQFRAFEGSPLSAIGVTMPAWPGAGEAVMVEGPWSATVPPGPN